MNAKNRSCSVLPSDGLGITRQSSLLTEVLVREK